MNAIHVAMTVTKKSLYQSTSLAIATHQNIHVFIQFNQYCTSVIQNIYHFSQSLISISKCCFNSHTLLPTNRPVHTLINQGTRITGLNGDADFS